MGDALAIEARGLGKTYGRTRALDGLDLDVEAGSILGMLGPNGAGKTTTVRVLSTLLRPDQGTARVAGHDVVTEAARVRRHIGLTGQYAALDESLTGRANLVMIGQLTRLTRREAKKRAAGLLDQFDLSGAADRGVKTYSGGMRRRLDLAASLVGRPSILFLDEPTTGLDLPSRMATWDAVRELTADGTTVLLTTQALDEADQLADRIAVVDRGRVIAEGTSGELKAKVGGERVQLTVAPEASLETALRALAPHADGPPVSDPADRTVQAPVTGAARRMPAIVRDLDAAGVLLDDLAIRRPSLDDVFLTLTGHVAEDTAAEQDARAGDDAQRAASRRGGASRRGRAGRSDREKEPA
jgi:ABC-2 type transport system ATP-binding protein